MVDIVKRQDTRLERTVNTGDYRDFRGISFKIISGLTPGQYFEFTTQEPTYIQQSTGAIKITARAPTIVEGNTGKITIEAHAPILVRGSTGGVDAHLRENSGIEGSTGTINIKAAPYLELKADNVSYFNGRYNESKPVHLNAPQGNRGFILFRGSTGALNFEYDGQSNLYLPLDSKGITLVRRIRALLK